MDARRATNSQVSDRKNRSRKTIFYWTCKFRRIGLGFPLLRGRGWRVAAYSGKMVLRPADARRVVLLRQGDQNRQLFAFGRLFSLGYCFLWAVFLKITYLRSTNFWGNNYSTVKVMD
jgi:hypothetical protein